MSFGKLEGTAKTHFQQNLHHSLLGRYTLPTIAASSRRNECKSRASRMTTGQLQFELQRGAKFVFYYYCVSLLVITFRRPSGICFLRAGESAVVKGLPWALLTVVAGWWGIPW